MEITVSSRQSKALFCLCRKEFVKETPEERVRQNTLSSLFLLGYPPSLIVVERKMADLVAARAGVPNRRLDILCYRGSTLAPLLLVECKANTFGDKELRQLLGYNFYVQARYIALVSPQKVLFFDVQDQTQQESFPPYNTLLV